MVTMKWSVDESGRPVPMWKTETPAASVRVFGTRYRKAIRLTTGPRHVARRPLRMTAAEK